MIAFSDLTVTKRHNSQTSFFVIRYRLGVQMIQCILRIKGVINALLLTFFAIYVHFHYARTIFTDRDYIISHLSVQYFSVIFLLKFTYEISNISDTL